MSSDALLRLAATMIHDDNLTDAWLSMSVALREIGEPRLAALCLDAPDRHGLAEELEARGVRSLYDTEEPTDDD